MNKVIRFELLPESKEDNTYELLWKLQRDLSVIANKTVQYSWENYNFEQSFFEKYENWPKGEDLEKVLGKKGISTYAYEKAREKYPYISSYTISSLTREVTQKFNSKKKAFFSGKESIMSFKSDLPIPIVKKQFHIEEILHSEGEHKGIHQYIFCCSLLSNIGKAEMGKAEIRMKMIVKAGNQIQFLHECNQLMQYKIEDGNKTPVSIEGDGYTPKYTLTGSKISYNKRNKRFYLNLGFSFEPKDNMLDKDRLLGVQIGYTQPIYCALSDSRDFLSIEQGEIDAFRKAVEARRISLCRQTKYCGEGRKGHGYETKLKSTEKISNSITNFKNTCNHKYSKAIIDFAVSHGAGTIVLKDITGIAENNLYLKRWSYYDLQDKLKSKAAEAGIEVIMAASPYSSRRCSKCGYINDKRDETEHDLFICSECRTRIPVDRNSAQNLATKDVELLIAQQAKQQGLEYKTQKKK